MKIFKPYICLLFLLITFSFKSLSQQSTDVARVLFPLIDSIPPGNLTSVLFDKSLNRYYWNGMLRYFDQFGPLQVKMLEQFQSTLIRTDKSLIRDEQLFQGDIKYCLTNNLQAVGRISSFILTDNQNIGIGNAETHGFYSGVDVESFRNIKLTPLVGMRFDKQIGKRDHGPSLFFSLSSDGLEYEGFRPTVNSKFQYDWLRPRRLETINNTVQIMKRFAEQSENIFRFTHYRLHREFYLPIITDDASLKIFNIDSRLEEGINASDVQDYAVGTKTFFKFFGSINSRRIVKKVRNLSLDNLHQPRFKNSIKDLRMEVGVSGLYRPTNKLNFGFQVLMYEQNQQHRVDPENDMNPLSLDLAVQAAEQKNNHARRNSLALKMNLHITQTDSITLDASSSLLRYDTPSKINNDDRDELWYLFSLTSWHHLSRFLQLSLQAQVNLTHQVYLQAARSADNTWNRIFKLSPKLHYFPTKYFQTTNRFDVISNYTVYDFETRFAATQSFSFREFSWLDSTTFNLTRRLTFEWVHYFRLSLRGDLHWQEFSERPRYYFEEFLNRSALLYQCTDYLLFSVGFRYFDRKQFKYSGIEKIKESNMISLGPLTYISLSFGNRSTVILNGWYEYQKYSDQTVHATAHITANIVVNF